MGIWAWVQPVDRIWKVVSDNEKGTICVYNEKSELVMEQKGMTKEEVSFIEDNFLKIVATNLSGKAEDNFVLPGAVNIPKPVQEHNYMYV